ncbi:hypothetical protein GUITHDRAFT_102325 [Guillardia theta CCMP2712]|uniref:Condensin complex subunit 1 C-terminal domain-containing protein n=1 Tax=Guillardia theta (strain CCMP2712) TaxID=905079 RepID=L1JU44_GUITC|nr:hypothetical protein GUITHDRAFT_102325 [Guillardia theta CCMP2712]EKX51720.1 hypothetical protein GUITHDRAFT_102325 [Guillardia theta CCMP2712]|eukprot:XP_005838700.1 hypothetical protein GUITHDRAFT_102325 [Guillardia theta CCMP2712]
MDKGRSKLRNKTEARKELLQQGGRIEDSDCSSPTSSSSVSKQVILELMAARGGQQFLSCYVRFACKLSRHEKQSTRMFAVEVAGSLLLSEGMGKTGGESDEGPSEEKDGRRSQHFREVNAPLLRMLLQRCSDKMPSVRAKAIANLACVMEREELLHALLQHMQEEQGAGDLSTMSRDLNQTSEQEVKLQLDSLMDIMKRRSEDSKSFVRKSSVQVLEVLLRHRIEAGEEESSLLQDVKLLTKRCTDISVLVRKQALDSVTNLLQEAAQQEKSEQVALLQVACRILGRRKPSGLPSGLTRKMMTRLKAISEEEKEEETRIGCPVRQGAALRLATRAAAHLSDDCVASLLESLQLHLKHADSPPQLLHDMCKAAFSLSRRETRNPQLDPSWAQRICNSSLQRLQPFVQRRLKGAKGREGEEEERMVRTVFVVGAMALEGAKISTTLSNTIQALLRPANQVREEEEDGAEQELQSHVLIALGKMCMQDASLASKMSSVFFRELQLTSSPVIRNNLLVILSDLCVRFTSLVDPHVSKLASCLRDPNAILRQHALTLITTLLCTDYVKWKGALFFRYILALVDENEVIRDQARKQLFNVLLPKSGHQICSAHLVESLFVLNDFTSHESFNRFKASPEERTRFSLPGKGDNQRRRREIYTLMLAHCSDEQKFQITAKLCEEVLGAVADGTMGLHAAEDVLGDALYLLSSKEIKLSALQKTKAGDEEREEEVAQAAATAARNKLLSQVVKKNVMQNVVPTLAGLKVVLEEQHSSLLGDLMRCFSSLLREFRSEIDDILASNRQLASELLYDLRLEETRPRAEEAAGGGGEATGSSLLCSPGTSRSQQAATPLSIPKLNQSAAKSAGKGMAEKRRGELEETSKRIEFNDENEDPRRRSKRARRS